MARSMRTPFETVFKLFSFEKLENSKSESVSFCLSDKRSSESTSGGGKVVALTISSLIIIKLVTSTVDEVDGTPKVSKRVSLLLEKSKFEKDSLGFNETISLVKGPFVVVGESSIIDMKLVMSNGEGVVSDISGWPSLIIIFFIVVLTIKSNTGEVVWVKREFRMGMLFWNNWLKIETFSALVNWSSDVELSLFVGGVELEIIDRISSKREKVETSSWFPVEGSAVEPEL